MELIIKGPPSQEFSTIFTHFFPTIFAEKLLRFQPMNPQGYPDKLKIATCSTTLKGTCQSAAAAAVVQGDNKARLWIEMYIPPKFNMEPKNEGLEDVFPFHKGDSQVPC